VSCVDPRFNARGLPYVWRTEIDAHGFGWYSTEFIAKTLAPKLGKQAKELRLAFISEDSAYGQGVTEFALKRAKDIGMEAVSVDYYNAAKITDFTPLILKLKSLNLDILHATPYTQDAILFWKQAKEHDLVVKALVHTGAVGFGSPDFGQAFGKDADGVLALLEPVGLNLEMLSPDARKWQAEADRRYEQKHGTPPPGAAQLSIAGMYILKLVLDRAGSLDPDKVRAAALGLDIPVGGAVMGWGVKFQENGQNANEVVQHYMNQWQEGKLVTVWPEQYAIVPLKFVPLPKWGER
jgi:branched-chain amino acid transport system substrate-binding protein